MRNNTTRLLQKFVASKAEYRWVSPENLHITMCFLGDIPDIEVPDLCRDVKRVAEAHQGFSVEIEGLGGFPNFEQPRTIWAGVSDGAEELHEINATLAELLRTWGIPKEKNKYLPHMTLGRLGRGGRWNEKLVADLETHRNHVFGSCWIDEVTVFSSHLDRFGPTYTPMARVKLKA